MPQTESDCVDPVENISANENIWLAVGQSNIENTMDFTTNTCSLFAVSAATKADSNGLGEESFTSLSKQGRFSSVAGQFAITLQRLTGQPIAVISSALGGTPLTCWREENECFEEYIRDLTDLPVKGIIWWQGETDGLTQGTTAEGYGNNLKEMINEWRTEFGDEIPFMIVQLQNYDPCLNAPPEIGADNCEETDSWSETRLGQEEALTLPNTFMVESLDITHGEIHPHYAYHGIAKRLAETAAKNIY